VKTLLKWGAVAAGAAFVALSVTPEARAQAYPTFELDASASSIDVVRSGCIASCPTLDAQIGPGADSFSWTPSGPRDRVFADDIFTWTASSDPRPGVTRFDVSAELVFDSPSPTSTGGTGAAFAISLFGDITGGILRWTGVTSATFADGSRLDIVFEEMRRVFTDGARTISTGALFIGNMIQPVDEGGGPTVPVPLPASIWMLMAGMGAVAFAARRRRRDAVAV
jgi:hypothetical protein